MSMLIEDAYLIDQVKADRSAIGADRYDEVWEGVDLIMPMPGLEHQRVVGGVDRAFIETVQDPGDGLVFPGCNISDRVENWMHNYRIPDNAVFLNDNPAENHRTFWFGGPDFAVEILSPDDRSRDKFEFYARIGTRELLLIDREPWALELYRLINGELIEVGRSTVDDPALLSSEVLPLQFRLITGDDRPQIEIKHTADDRVWIV